MRHAPTRRLRALCGHLTRRTMSSAAGATDEVLVERRGLAACITLNRPRALNALNLPMIRALSQAYRTTAVDASVGCIVLTGAGEKAFCAGGDVVGLWEAARAAPPTTRDCVPDAFFREEYALNAAIAGCPVPQVAVWDGICMGGGVGVSIHGAYRVATERALFAMPETAIGFFPDVGGTHFLSALGGGLGPYIGLTGARLGAADLMYTGMATHFVPSAELPAMHTALEGARSEGFVRAALDAACQPDAAGESKLAANRAAIDRCFDVEKMGTVEAIEAALDAEGTEWAGKTLKALRGASPTSLKLTLHMLREARGEPLSACLAAEFRATQRAMVAPSDFFEGIRAALVDKDKSPRWDPATLAEVSDGAVAEFGAGLGERELDRKPWAGFKQV